EWMSAHEAIQLLQPFDADAKRAICRRAHAGLLKARARLLIVQDKEATDSEVPREFWWAHGSPWQLTQNWVSGDFETYINHPSVRVRAFGVTFRRSDIERMKPASAANPTVPPSPVEQTSPPEAVASR